MPAVLISLMAGLCSLAAAPQAALAATPAMSSISAGNGITCAIESGKAYCWGTNYDNGLGDGKSAGSSAFETAGSSVPVAVDTSGVLAGKTLTQIATGNNTTCVLDAAGAAYCWGDDGNGELGDGSTTTVPPFGSDVPVAVDTSGALAGKTLTQIAIGNDHTCALDAAGTAFCWGDNQVGALGDGSRSSSSVPVAVDTSGALAGKVLTQITAGFGSTCALTSTGAAYCWGWDPDGELGDGGNNATSTVPVAVDVNGVLAGKALIQIAATGMYDTCALASTGTAYCWGNNALGQLGDGNTNDSNVPVAVDTSGALAGQILTRITAGGGGGDDYACALDAAGTAYCWGYNGNGELGDGSTATAPPFGSDVPVAVDTSGVLAGKTLTRIADGDFATCALDATGTAYCWGGNESGELGDDSLSGSDVPLLLGLDAPAGAAALPGDNAATVSWAAPRSLDGATLTGYTATAAPGGAACTTTRATTCTITGLTNGTAYSITVVARTTAGDTGASTPVTVTPGPVLATGPIISGDAATACVEDPGNATVNDTPIVISGCTGSAGQNWTIDADETIGINGKCMDIYRDEKTNNAPVELWNCTGGANQEWKPVNGTLVNPVSGKCLDDPGFNTADGTQLEIYTCNGGLNQQWQLP